MATKDYSSYSFSESVTENAVTYYDVVNNGSNVETETHKFMISASASSQSTIYINGRELKQASFTLTGVPNLTDPNKFQFKESNCDVDLLDNEIVSANNVTLQQASGVTHFFGTEYDDGIYRDIYVAFEVEVDGNFVGIGSRQGSTGYSYTESTRTLTFNYVAFNTAGIGLVPFRAHFAGTEAWVKAYTNTYEHYLEADSTPVVHLGKTITSSELNGLAWKRDDSATAPTRNGYAWPDGVATSTVGNIVKTIQPSDLAASKPEDNNFVLRVPTTLVDGDGKTVVLTSTPTIIGLSNNPFSSFTPGVSAYHPGDTISLNDIIASVTSWSGAVLTYSDNSTIHLSQVELATGQSISASMSIKIDGTTRTDLRSLTLENLVSYTDCYITLTIPTKHFGTLTYTYLVSIVSVLAYAVTLSNIKTDYIYGEIATYGSGATATLYDNNGNIIETDSVAQYLSDGVLFADLKIATSSAVTSTADAILDGHTGQGIIETTLQNGNSYKYLIYVSYCDSFELSETNLGDVYVNSGVSTSISSLISGITARYAYHHNTSSISETTNVNVANSGLTPSTSTITATSDTNNYKVYFTHTPTESANQTLSAYASFNIKINRFVSLSVSHTATGNTYYAGRTNTFVIPSDIVIKKVYNNPSLASVTLDASEIASVEYRTAEGTSSAALVAGTSTIPASTNTIYVTLELQDGTILQGSYSIAGDYQTDTVTAIRFGTSFNFILGNKLSKYKNNGSMVLIAHYASGYATDTTDDIFTDYTIVQLVNGNYVDVEKVVMAPGDTYYVKHNGNYYAVGYEDGVSITYSAPVGVIQLGGHQQTYINTVDKIDFREVTATISYPTADPSTSVVATFDSGNVPSTSTYALSCMGITDFDGTEAFNITEEGLTFTKTITVSAINRFDNNDTITASVDVTVIAIAGLSIVRLGVRNPKTEYSVGEKFLNATDNTLLDIFYSGSTTPITVYLKDVPSVVATDPSQGTEFTRTNDSMTVTVRFLTDPTKYTNYTARVVANRYSSLVTTRHISTVLIPNGPLTNVDFINNNTHYYYDSENEVVVAGWYILVDEENTEINANGARVLATGVSLSSVKIYGYLEDAFNKSVEARVILFDDYIPPLAGESNIEVKYPCYVEGNADKIDKCHIAKLFGNSNAKNRLFVSGNPDFKNCDWHSGAVNAYLQEGEAMDANGDFTYFGDMDYCFYGQTDNAIMGYDNVATDKMVVLKSKSRVEPTNYFRTSTLVQAIDAGGNAVQSVDGSTLYQEAFPLATGNVGEGMLNQNAIVNLNGDTLYIASNNTICGLDIAGQVGDSQRISYSRSRYIDPELKTLDLSNAVIWTDNVSLFLFADDATYMTNYSTLDGETGQYEWWKLDAKAVRCAIEIDGVIYFGSEDGSLYKFDKDIYYDCDKIFIEAGGALYVSLSTLFSDNKIVYAQDVNDEIEDGKTYTFTMKPASLNKSLFRKVASIGGNDENGVDLAIDYATNSLRIVARDANGNYDPMRAQILQEELAQSGKFYLNYADGKSAIEAISGSSLAQYYRPYTLVPTEALEDTFKMFDSNGNEVELARTVTSGGQTSTIAVLISANLCRVLDGIYDVFALNKAECSFKLSENGRELDIVRYGDQNLSAQSFVCELHKHTPVYSYFIAAPSVLGDVNYRKTIWAWTLSAFKEPNDLQVCQATNDENLENMKAFAFADNIPVGFDLADLSIMRLDFEKSAVPRKFTYFRPISVPYIAFGFKSDKAENSILTATSIVYTIPLLGWGNN